MTAANAKTVERKSKVDTFFEACLALLGVYDVVYSVVDLAVRYWPS